MSNKPDGRKRILKAAIKIFSEKSFDGARISDISKAANVPGSLIYYHFKSKEDILEVLIDNFLAEFTQLSQIAKNDSHSEKPKNIVNRLENHYFNFAQNNVELIRIILFESLKKNVEKPPIFKFVEGLLENDGEAIKSSKSYNLDERRVAEFFTSLLPMCFFLCFKKQWCDYFYISQKDLNLLFTNIIAETHGAYHKNRIEGDDYEGVNYPD